MPVCTAESTPYFWSANCGLRGLFFIWFLDSGSVKDSLQCFYHLRENFFLCLVAINQQLIDTYCVVKGKFILLFTKNFQEKFSEWVAKSPLIEYNKSEPKAPCSGT